MFLIEIQYELVLFLHQYHFSMLKLNYQEYLIMLMLFHDLILVDQFYSKLNLFYSELN